MNKIKTPQSLFLAKERDKWGLQKSLTCIKSAKMHKNNICVLLEVPAFISQYQIFLEITPCFWQNLFWGKFHIVNCKKMSYFLVNFGSLHSEN